MPKKIKQDPKLLREIQENYAWANEYWSPIHKEGATDVRFIAGDPWDPRDIQARDALEQKRPHLIIDAGSQYINLFIGQAAQQKRSPKVDPVNEQTDAKTAEMFQARLFHIEYASRGQTHCLKALADCAKRGYGWIRLGKKYSQSDGRLQEPCYMPVGNPDSVLMDPTAKEKDGSDAEFMFVRDVVKRSYVKRKYPNAKDLGNEADGTINYKECILVEYWKVTKENKDTTYLLKTDDGEVEKKASELDSEPDEDTILDERDTSQRRVTKYICQMLDPNLPAGKMDSGAAEDVVEILEVEEWDGKYIPLIPVLGMEEYVDHAGQTQKVYLSLLRRARDSMQLLNLTRTNEAELVAMTPKTRFIGYEGQFEGHEAEFNNIGQSPLGYLQVKAVPDPMSPGQPLPLPTPLQWEPPIQSLELLANSCLNDIRSAIGQLASPELDKTKSGVALEKIREGGESAVYHIIDAYESSLEQAARVLGDLGEVTHDSDRTEPVRSATGEQSMVRFNAVHPHPETGKPQQFNITKDGFSYTLSVGPSYQSQFQQASDFVDLIVQKMPNLLMDQTGHTFLGDLVVQIKNLGPIGDEIMDRFKKKLDPALVEQGMQIPPQVQAQMQQAQQIIQLLTGKVNALHDVIDRKQIEQEAENARNDRDNKTRIAIAEINASVKENVVQLQGQMDAIAQSLNHQFELISLGIDQKFQAQQATQQQNAAASQQQAQLAAQSQAPEAQGTGGNPAATHIFNPEAQAIEPVGQGGTAQSPNPQASSPSPTA